MPPSAREQIEDTLNRWALGYDDNDWSLVADCFTDDAVFSMRIADGEIIGPFEGREVILDVMREASRSQEDQRRHVTSNLVVEQDGATATSAAYLTLFSVRDGTLTALSTGKYEDELVRTDAGWKLAKRHIALDLPY